MSLKIFILAGGFGTRLQSVVNNVPKPMAPISDAPFLDYQIKEIRKFFNKEIIYLLTYYKSDVIEEYYKNDELIKVIKENMPLGTGGSVKNAINAINVQDSDKILVLNGDTYMEPNLRVFVENSRSNVNMIVSLQEDCGRYGALELVKDQVVAFKEKYKNIKNNYINSGCYFFKNTDFFSEISEKQFSIEDKFMEYINNNNKIEAFEYNGIFIDIGVPEDYEKMNNYVREV